MPKFIREEDCCSGGIETLTKHKEEVKSTAQSVLEGKQTIAGLLTPESVNLAFQKALEESAKELNLKRIIANFTMAILFFELAFFGFVLIKFGLKQLVFSDEIVKVYIVSIVGQIITTFYVMVKFLFDPNRPSTMKIVDTMVKANIEEVNNSTKDSNSLL
ncbi:hypothetical protein IMX26_05580 [Clostridium sp. 'deep sea']|uniref:hypothetical protein n=1 Tax=Clostridium sp. 'deep sea' TaxID=2779445 RepID=UPI0018968F32|nr:hypothetical protein [Clostridium sp. 'deep sea']QOR36284.1 hypothetical protein IMX26_05580 [Clostridium sp. 'deep sea']